MSPLCSDRGLVFPPHFLPFAHSQKFTLFALMSTLSTEIERSTNPITLTRFLIAERKKYRNATGDFGMVMQSIQLACKAIANASKKAGIANLHGVATGQENSSGDVQKKLDVMANDVFINTLSFSGGVHMMVSEENEDVILVDDNDHSSYSVVFDPLDGSSNIDANVSVGTIFGIYKRDDNQQKSHVKDVLKPGRELVAAGYALYGSATNIVLTTGLGVNCFTLDPSLGEFILTHKNMRMPRNGVIYSCNEGNYHAWDANTKAFIDHVKSQKGTKARYVGSMVADIHRTILYGGIFFYPADKKNTSGKLRLLYECNPIAMIMEQAGGLASTGTMRVLDIMPKNIHERNPIYCGSYDNVKLLESFYKPAAKL